MKLQCRNGFLEIGDICTGYHKGYWKVTGLKERQGSTGIVEYTRIDKKANKSCDAAWCTKIDINQHCRELHEEIDQLHALLTKAKNA